MQSTNLIQYLSNTNDNFHRTRTNNSKICMEMQKSTNRKNNLEKEEKTWRNHTRHYELYYKAIVIKTDIYINGT